MAAIGRIGFIALSLYLAWIAAPDYGVERWQALGLVLAAYLAVALSSWGVALVYNRTVDRQEAQAGGETETGTTPSNATPRAEVGEGRTRWSGGG